MTDSEQVKAGIAAAADKANSASFLIKSSETTGLDSVGSALNQARNAIDEVSQTIFRTISELREAKSYAQSVLVGIPSGKLEQAMVHLHNADNGQEELLAALQRLKNDIEGLLGSAVPNIVSNKDEHADHTMTAERNFREFLTLPL